MNLVSVGVPVRNGAAFLDEALMLLRQQTYEHLEIIVSDNASDDGSTDIIQRHAADDKRIRVYRQDVPLTGLANFRFVFEKSHGDYFMWAACDDRRSLDYVERLLATLQLHPGASLAFGDLVNFSDPMNWKDGEPVLHAFETKPSESWRKRVLRITRSRGHHVYGLIRSNALRSYEWLDIVDRHNDVPLNVHLIIVGELVRSPGCCFYYYRPTVPKSVEESALTNNLKRPKPFPELRMAWACAKSAKNAVATRGGSVFLVAVFSMMYANRHWRWIKPWLFEHTPKPLVNIYRQWFKRASV